MVFIAASLRGATVRRMELGQTAIGSWSGGRFMHFGEPVDEARLERLIRPGDGIDTVITADVYGAGAADSLVGRAIAGLDRDAFALAGAVGHDFLDGERDGPRGYPRFTDPRLRGEGEYASYLRRATEASLERLGVDELDLLLLHNPDRTGFTSTAVWEGMAALRDAGLTAAIGVAPGPANGFTLDLIDCFERFGDQIEWAMVILNPLEPWPGELVLGAAAKHGIRVITRVVDYGGLFWGDVPPGHRFADSDHRRFRPDGWVEAGNARLERMRPVAGRRRADSDRARLPVEPRPRRRRVHGSDADPGGGRGGADDRVEARRARRRAGWPGSHRGRGRRDPRDRRQHRLDGAQGREPRARGRRAPRPLAARRAPRRDRAALGDRPRRRPSQARQPVARLMAGAR